MNVLDAAEKELVFPLSGKAVDVGSLSPEATKRLQEWLTLQGYGLVIDGEPGPATRSALTRFQSVIGYPDDMGYLGVATWRQLVAPMAKAFVIPRKLDNDGRERTLRQLVKILAGQHLAQAPREVGGDNCGPWVRAYTGGHEGKPWKWCAGFVTTLLAQAAQALGIPSPIPFTLDCDQLESFARSTRRLVMEGNAGVEEGDVFLCMDGEDAYHTGILTKKARESCVTVEGNTNEAGSSNGNAVAQKTRSYAKKRFIRLFEK